MQFANPTSLLWLLVALPLVALFLLRAKPRRLPVATVMFWHEAIPDSRPRRWWQRLRDPLMLLLQLLFLLLLALALAEPRWQDGFTPPQTMIVLLDTSSSMRASHDGMTRLELAKQRVLKAMREMRSEDRMALIEVSSQPRILHGLTASSRSLRQTLRQVVPSDGEADFEAAAALVDALADPDGRTRLICATDAAGKVSAPPLLDDRSEWWIVGRPMNNTAITKLQVRRPWDDPMDVEVLIELSHFPIAGATPSRSGSLQVEVNDQLVDVVPWSVDASSPWRSIQRYRDVSGGIVKVTNTVDDTFHWDDEAYATLSPRTRRTIWLVGPRNVYLQGVLAALPSVDVEVKSELPESVPEDTVLIVYETEIAKFPTGNVMVIEPTALPDPWTVSSTSSAEWIVPPAENEPLVSHATFRDVLAQGVRPLQVPDDARVLLRAGAEIPLYVHWRHRETDLLVLNVALVDGDFVWRSLFPLLIARAINWFNREDDRLVLATAAGQVATVPPTIWRDMPSPDSGTMILQSPDGQTRTLPMEGLTRTSNEPVVIGRLDQIGIWRIVSATPFEDSSTGRDPASANADSPQLNVSIPCNLVNVKESDLRLAGTSSGSEVNGTRSGHPVWYFLLVTALFLTATEWWLYQRRWIG